MLSIQEFPTPKGSILRIFRPEDSPAKFSLINQNREHLSQHGDITAAKYPTEDQILHSIIGPSNSDKLRYGIWTKDNEYVGTTNFTPDKDNLASQKVLQKAGYLANPGGDEKGNIRFTLVKKSVLT